MQLTKQVQDLKKQLLDYDDIKFKAERERAEQKRFYKDF